MKIRLSDDGEFDEHSFSRDGWDICERCGMPNDTPNDTPNYRVAQISQTEWDRVVAEIDEMHRTITQLSVQLSGALDAIRTGGIGKMLGFGLGRR